MKLVFDKEIENWAKKYQFKFTFFSMIIFFLFLLRSAGYFHPFYTISVNIIIFSALILSIFILDARSRSIFAFALAFWLFAAVMRILGVNVWAERTAIYVFQAVAVGVLVLIFEIYKERRKSKE